MCCVQRIGNLNRQTDQNVGLERSSGDAVLQRHAVQKLHGDERLPVLLTNVVNRADVWVIQCGCSLGFALKAGECLRITGNFLGQELQRDKTTEPGVFRLVDHAHTAAAQLLNDAVVRDRSPDHWRKSYVGELGKSMKAWELAVSQEVVDGTLPITPTTPPEWEPCSGKTVPNFVSTLNQTCFSATKALIPKSE